MPDASSRPDTLVPEEVKPVDLTSPLHVMHGRLPAVDVIQDRVSRQIRAELFQYMHYGVQIESAKTRFESHDEAVRDFKQPGLIGIVSMAPLRGFSILAVDGPLVAAVVDRLCGAEAPSAETHPDDFSPLEARVARRVLDILGECVVFAWKGIADVDMQLIRTERNASFVAIADAREQLIVTRVRISMATGTGEVTIAIPYTAIEPIRDRLSTGMALTAVHGDDLKRWLEHLTQALDNAPAPLRVELTRLRLSVGTVAHLQPGQIIPIPEPHRVRAYCGGVHLFDGEFGVRDHSVAIRVTRFARSPSSSRRPHDD